MQELSGSTKNEIRKAKREKLKRQLELQVLHGSKLNPVCHASEHPV
jgi:hypothetical protein